MIAIVRLYVSVDSVRRGVSHVDDIAPALSERGVATRHSVPKQHGGKYCVTNSHRLESGHGVV